MAAIVATLLGQRGIRLDTLLESITRYKNVIPLTVEEIKEITANTLAKLRGIDITKIFDNNGEVVGLGTGGIGSLVALERDFQIQTWFNQIDNIPASWDALMIDADSSLDQLFDSLSAGDKIVDSIGKVFPEFQEFAAQNFSVGGTIANTFIDSNGEIASAFEVLMEQFGSENLQTLVAASEIIETSSSALADLVSGGIVAGFADGALGLVTAVATVLLTNISKITSTIWTAIAGKPMDYSKYKDKPIVDTFIKAYVEYLSNSNNYRFGLFGQGRDAVEKGFWNMISMMVRDFLRTYTTQYVPSVKMFVATNLVLKQLEAYNTPDNTFLTDAQKSELKGYLDGDRGLLAQYQDVSNLLNKISNEIPDILNDKEFGYNLDGTPGRTSITLQSVKLSGDKISLWIKECLLLSRKIAALYKISTTLAGYEIGNAKKGENDKLVIWAVATDPSGTVVVPKLPDSSRTEFPTMPPFPIFNFFPKLNLNDLINGSRTGLGTDTATAVGTLTDTLNEEEEEDKNKKKKKKKKKKRKKTTDKMRIQFISADVSKYSKWLQYIDFEFDTRNRKESNRKGKVTITLKNNKTYYIGVFKRGVYSNSVMTLIGAGYGYWRNFNYHNLVRTDTISYNLPRPSLHRQIRAISKEIKSTNVTYN